MKKIENQLELLDKHFKLLKECVKESEKHIEITKKIISNLNISTIENNHPTEQHNEWLS